MYNCYEICPHCDFENVYEGHNPEKHGYVVTCNDCGREMFLCDACRHAEDYGGVTKECNWHLEKGKDGIYGVCHRGKYKMEEPHTINANMYCIVEPTEKDKERIYDAINVMQEIVDGVAKCYGHYDGYGVLDQAIDELKLIISGKMMY